MKRKFIVLSFMLSFLTFVSGGLNAQNDAYFSTTREYRLPEAAGMSFEGISGQFGYGFKFDTFMNQHDGFEFEQFTVEDAPLASGLLLMTATSLFYLINKRRKEN